MKQRRVIFTATARRHISHEHQWWLEHRDYPDIYSAELEAALKILSVMPAAGSPYPGTSISGLRRLYVEKVAHHLYYTFDDEQIIVRAFWGARRGRGPTFRQTT